MSIPIRACCLIPSAVRTKSQPVTASIRIPAGAAEVVAWPIVTKAMLQKDAFSATVEWLFLNASKQPLDDRGSVRADGDPSLIPVGIVGGQPGQTPDSTMNFDLETEDRISPAGGMSVPAGAEYVQVTLIPEGGNNGGDIWCGCVVTAQAASGEYLDFDTSTRGS